MGGRTIYRTLSPKRTPFQTGIDRWPHLWMVPGKRWISHMHPMWLWGHRLFKILSPGPVFYGTKWLLWCPHKQSPTFHSKCKIDKGLIRKGSTIDHWRSQCKGQIIMAHSLCIHSTVSSTVFWLVMPYDLGRAWSLTGVYHFHHQGWRVSQARKQAQLSTCFYWCLSCITLQPWRQRLYLTLKCLSVSELHVITTQKIYLSDLNQNC
jgi:hypothetical protein